MRSHLRSMAALGLTAALFAALTTPTGAQNGDQWGTVKGKVTYGGAAAPKPMALNVDKDQAHCLATGKPILSEEWIVDPATMGVANVFVWLAPMEDDGKMPVHPKLKEPAKKEVEIDQPMCKFIPHAVAVREGQVLIAKNSSPIQHNFRYNGHPLKNPGNNFLIPPGKQVPIKDLAADKFPVMVSCDIHKWMKAWVRVFDHPYYAVTKTDGSFEMPMAPAGKYRLFVWHPASGFLGGAKGRNGQQIEIKADGTDVGNLKLQPTK